MSHSRPDPRPRSAARAARTAQRFIQAAAYPGSWCQFVTATIPSARYTFRATRSIPGTSLMSYTADSPATPTESSANTIAVAYRRRRPEDDAWSVSGAPGSQFPSVANAPDDEGEQGRRRYRSAAALRSRRHATRNTVINEHRATARFDR